MITGIYILRFVATDKVYIGQAIDIDLRYKTHKASMKANKCPRKLQEAYNIYGLPKLEILVECSINELDNLEIEAINIFNAVEDGFNTLDGNTYRSTLKGELAGNAKYTNDQIEEVFIYLVDNKLTFKEIAEITGVNRGVISDLSSGMGYTWLQEKYPQEYARLKDLKGYVRKTNRRSAKSQGIEYPKIQSPTGLVYTVSSLRGFCREHNLNHGSIGEVLRGHKHQYKGWKVYNV